MLYFLPNLTMSHIFRSSLILSIFFGLDKVLGLIRQTLIARQFRLSYDIDVFNAANNIPDLLSALISGGALGVALIPVLSEYLQKGGSPKAWDVFSRILNLAFLTTASLAFLIGIFASPLVSRIIAPGFPPAQKELTIELLRLDLIAILIFSISGLIMAGLQANQHFILPAMAPGLYNLGQIFGAAILAPVTGYHLGMVTLPAFGFGIHGLVYGVILGAVLHLSIQIPGLIRYKFRWTWKIDLHHPAVIQVLRLLGPRILTMFFIQLFFITRDNLASRLNEGAVTALNYGWFIMQVPETLIGTAISIVLLPTLAEQYIQRDFTSFIQTINRGITVLFAGTIPIAGIMAVGIRPIIQALFHFDTPGTEMVVWASRFYLIGLAGHALLEIAARSFYAMQDARTPLFAAGINAIGYIILAGLLYRPMGINGIALANSIAFTGEALLLLFLFHRRIPGLSVHSKTIPRVILAFFAGASTTTGILFLLPASPVLASIIGLICGGILSCWIVFPDIRLLVDM